VGQRGRAPGEVRILLVILMNTAHYEHCSFF